MSGLVESAAGAAKFRWGGADWPRQQRLDSRPKPQGQGEDRGRRPAGASGFVSSCFDECGPQWLRFDRNGEVWERRPAG